MTQTQAQQGHPAAAELHHRALADVKAGRFKEGIALLETALALAPRVGVLHADLGFALWQSGKPLEAEKRYAEALRLAPEDPRVLNGYGGFLLELRQLDQAERHLKKAYALKPTHPEIVNNLGLLEYRRGNHRAAGPLFLKAIELAPAWSAPYAYLGATMRDMGSWAQSEPAFLKALELDPRNAVALREIGHLYFLLGKDVQGVESLRRALALDPRDEAAWVLLLGELESLNRLEDMGAVLAEAKQAVPACPAVTVHEGRLLDRRGKTAEAIALFEKLRPGVESRPQRSHPFITGFFYDLGRLYDRAGEADKAFACFVEANRREAENPRARSLLNGQLSREIVRVRQGFTAEVAKRGSAAPPAPLQPVFLVGFPRSGTTLLEQVLAGHPDIHVTEERSSVEAMGHYLCNVRAEATPGLLPDAEAGFARGLFHAACLIEPRAEDLAEMRRIYYADQRVDPAKFSQKILVDKMPLNMLQAGLIRRVFPEAKIALVLRHPCDAVLSCFMQRFMHNPSMARFLDLKDAARFYDESFGLWEHYRSVLGLDVHVLRYEDVVADFRGTVGGLLHFLGAEWRDGLENFDETARRRAERIKTPSYRQVTEKLYARASGRWLKYRRHLEPVLDILAPHAERYGYSV
jgi:tetratricopeptide (TPR) repeat protein